MGLQYRKGKVTLQYLEEKPEAYKAIQLTFPKVTYEQLLEMIQIVGVSKAQTRAVVEALLTSLVHYMEIGHAVSLGQFGSFKPVFNSKTTKLLDDVDAKIEEGDIEGAKDICRDTRGPVASICYQGLLRADDSVDSIERSITSYGQVQVSNLEKGCSWITLFIAIAPSLGFLGTVIGMVMAFDEIQEAGDISPTVVASGMKVALITTIFGIIVALILQVFYNYILNKIEQLTTQMEDAAITLLDILVKYKNKVQ